MAENITTISRTGGIPEVEIVIGQAQFGKYEIYLWDADGTNPKLIGTGLNADNLPDVFPIAPASTLDGKMLSWQAIVTAPKKGPGQKYSVTVVIRQDSKTCPDSPFSDSGSLNGTKIVHDYTRFKAS